jgi:hypothetical protein
MTPSMYLLCHISESNEFICRSYIVHPHLPRRHDPNPHQNSQHHLPPPFSLPSSPKPLTGFYYCGFDDFANVRGEEGSETAACEGGVDVWGSEGVKDADVGCVAIGIKTPLYCTPSMSHSTTTKNRVK